MDKIMMKMKLELNLPKQRNFVAKDLRTPKYRMRVVMDKRKRKEKYPSKELV
jgi:hypothetical protein